MQGTQIHVGQELWPFFFNLFFSNKSVLSTNLSVLKLFAMMNILFHPLLCISFMTFTSENGYFVQADVLFIIFQYSKDPYANELLIFSLWKLW